MLPQHDPFLTQPEGARCARHPGLQAGSICSRCGSYACAQCNQLGSDGMNYCVDCQARVPVRASRGARFVANLVDQFAIILPFMLGIVLQVIIDSSSRGAERDFFLIGLGGLITLGVAGYQVYLLAVSGQSIGKRMLKIRVLRTDGSPASLGRLLLLRNVVPAVINGFCGLFSIVDALFIFGEERRCLHDILADTQVVEAPSEDLGA